jgi:malonate decarboxylase alpha subunit
MYYILDIIDCQCYALTVGAIKISYPKAKIKMKWDTAKKSKAERMSAAAKFAEGKRIAGEHITAFLEAVIRPGDRVSLEGDNQKQADFLAKALLRADPEKIHDLNMIIPSVSLREHLELFDRGIARTLNFAFSGPQSSLLAEMVEEKKIEIASICTYLELYGRLFVDLTPNICLIAAESADNAGNLYTGANTEDSPVLAEAAAFKNGIVIAQVNKTVDARDIPRVDIPSDRVDYIVEAPAPFGMEPLFTRDPAAIGHEHILMGMMTIKGIYAKHQVTSLNHGIGFNGAAIELLLPTFGKFLGLKGKICTHWVLNPHPTLIPAIESGWVKQVYAFGGEPGMEEYIRQRPDIFFTGRDGSLRSNRALAQTAGLYGIDLFLGATLQMDYSANSSTVTAGRLSGFGGAPNMGHNCGGRRHTTPAWNSMVPGKSTLFPRGKKLVVQMLKSKGKFGSNFVPVLDAVDIGKTAELDSPPVMIYGDDVTHVVTEQGIAYLYLARNEEERAQMLACVAQGTPLGSRADDKRIKALRKSGKVAYPQDMSISPDAANRKLLSANSLHELEVWSKGLYKIPEGFPR